MTMGWSCSVKASNVERAWSRACTAQTGDSNTFQSGGQTYFYEVSRTEHPDGAITGTVFRMVSKTHARPSGTFRISGDGEVERAPAYLRDIEVPQVPKVPLFQFV